jgi:hypothetical protein
MSKENGIKLNLIPGELQPSGGLNISYLHSMTDEDEQFSIFGRPPREEPSPRPWGPDQIGDFYPIFSDGRMDILLNKTD